MKKTLLLLLLIVHCIICGAQKITNVKIYITNPYVERINCVKSQFYNMDYVRCHYATYINSIEENFINTIYDSLMSKPLTKVAKDSLEFVLPYSYSGGPEVIFEPCIVIDFILPPRIYDAATNENVMTFAVNKKGYVCRMGKNESGIMTLYYPDKSYIDFLKRQFRSLLRFSYYSAD